MLSQIYNGVRGVAYTQTPTEKKVPKPNAKMSKEGDGTSKVQRLKEDIEAGSYKIDLSVLAKKMADDLL